MEEKSKEKILMVSGKTKVAALASAIKKEIEQNGIARMQAIGAEAVNQMVKAAARAAFYMEEEGSMLILQTHFVGINHNKSAIRMSAVLYDGD